MCRVEWDIKAMTLRGQGTWLPPTAAPGLMEWADEICRIFPGVRASVNWAQKEETTTCSGCDPTENHKSQHAHVHDIDSSL